MHSAVTAKMSTALLQPDLPQVDSLMIFLVMAPYISTIKIEKSKNPRNKQNVPNKPSAEVASELRSAEGRTRTGRNRAKDFAKVYVTAKSYLESSLNIEICNVFCGLRTRTLKRQMLCSINSIA